jgi:hypothetical protein
MVVLMKKELWFFNVGVNNIYLYNGHNERRLGDTSGSPYSSGRCALSPKYMVGIMSDGVHSVTHPMERLTIVASDADISGKSLGLIEAVNAKRLNNQRNATAILIEVAK